MIKELKQLIYHCAYEDAAKICESLDYNQLEYEIGWMGFDDGGIDSFGFVEYMVIKTEETKWIDLLSYICEIPLSGFGGENYSLYCDRELLKRDRSVQNLKRVAYYSQFKGIKSKETIKLITEIIERDPSSKSEWEGLLKLAEKDLANGTREVDENTLENALYTSDFVLLEAFFEGKTTSQIQQEIYDICLVDQESSSYAFCDYMYRKTKDFSWMQTGIRMLRGPLRFYDGAETVAFGLEKNLLNNYIQG